MTPKVDDDQIQMVSVSMLRPNTWNPNSMDDRMMAALKANIKRQGFLQPLLVRGTEVEVTALGDAEPRYVSGAYEIVDGEHRFHAAVALGYKTLPVIVTELPDAEARAQTLAMNRLRGEMEPMDVARLIREVESDGLSLTDLATFTGYSSAELDTARSLLDFDWSSGAADPAPTRERAAEDRSGGDEWVTLSYRIPSEVAKLFAEQIGRVRRLAGDCPDHMAIEAIVACAMQAPDADFSA